MTTRQVAVLGMGLVLGLFGCAREARVDVPQAAHAALAPSEAGVTKTAPERVAPPAPGFIADVRSACPESVIEDGRRELYLKACQANDADACAKAGLIYACGSGVVANGEAAVSFFERACKGGDEEGCFAEGVLLVDGTLVPRDVARGVRVLDRGCERKVGKACEIAGVLRLATDADDVQRHGLAQLDQACALGAAGGCANRAVAEVKGLGGAKKDHARAFGFAKRACEGKNLAGCNMLGQLYVTGTGTAKDERMGAKIFAAACDAGRADACLNLAKCQYNGVGVSEDKAKAISTLRRACDGNDGEACRLLADAAAAAGASYTSPAGPGVF